MSNRSKRGPAARGVTDSAGQTSTLRDRCQRRPTYMKAVYPGQNTRLVPYDRFRWRAHLIGDAGHREIERADERSHRALTCRAGRRARPACATVTAVGNPLLTATSIRSHIRVPLRGRASRFQHRHGERHHLRSPDRACGARDLRTSRGLQLRPQWPLQGRLDHASLWSAPPMDCTRSRWSLRNPAISKARRRPSPIPKKRPRACGPCLPTYSIVFWPIWP